MKWVNFIDLWIFILDLDNVIVNISNKEPNYNSSVVIECFADANPNLDHGIVSWKKNGKFISTGSVLSFNSVGPTDNGLYECTIKNVVGSKVNTTTMNVQCKHLLWLRGVSKTATHMQDGELSNMCDWLKVDKYFCKELHLRFKIIFFLDSHAKANVNSLVFGVFYKVTHT